MDHEKNEMVPIPFKLNLIETQNLNTILRACEDTHRHLKMTGILGYTGAGKSTALEIYQRETKGVYLVNLGKSQNAKHFYISMLESFGHYDQSPDTHLHYIIKKICYILNSTSSAKLLVIDEAGKITSNMMQYIHELRDQTKKTTGIVISGPDYLDANLKKWVSKNIIGIPEFYGRVNHWEMLPRPTKAEKKAVCMANDISDMEMVKKICATCHDFRSIENAIMNIKTVGYL